MKWRAFENVSRFLFCVFVCVCVCVCVRAAALKQVKNVFGPFQMSGDDEEILRAGLAACRKEMILHMDPVFCIMGYYE